MNDAAAYLAIVASDRLPTPGPVALELTALVQQVDVDFADVVRVVASDPAICARALRAVNSAAHGAGRRVATVDDAVRLLGLRGIARLAIEVSVLERNRGGIAEFDYGTFWADALARAVAAQVLGRLTRRVPADEAFTYGLLSTIGRLALVSVHTDVYRQMLLTLGRATAAEREEAERAVFQVDVELLSALMLRSWGLPALHVALGAPMADGETLPRTERDTATLRICRAAGHVAGLLTAGSVSRRQLGAAMQALADVSVGAELAAEAFPDIVEGFRDSGALLAIRTPVVGTLAEIYAHATEVPAQTNP